MNDDLGSWSRHYDTLLWTVTGIMVTANGGLLLFAWNSSSPPLWPTYAVGIILSLVSIYFAASFRAARKLVHSKMSDDKFKEIIRGSKKLKQWVVFVAIFAMLLCFWIALLIQNYPAFVCLWIALGFVVLSVMVFLAVYDEKQENDGT